MSTTSKQFLAIFGLIAVTVVWGTTFILVKWTVAEMDVFYFLFLRFFTAFLFMAILFRKKIIKIDLRTIW